MLAHKSLVMIYSIVGNAVAHWRRCGGSLEEMQWLMLIGGDAIAHWRWLIGRDAGTHWRRCGGSVVEMQWLIGGYAVAQMETWWLVVMKKSLLYSVLQSHKSHFLLSSPLLEIQYCKISGY